MTTTDGRASFIPDAVTAEDRAAVSGQTRAVALLTGYVLLLMFIPSDLVWSPLGGAGGPATIFAAGILVWYLFLWARSASRLSRGVQPIRTVALILGGIVLASYISANRNSLPILERNAADRGLISLAGWLGVLLLAADGIPGWDSLNALMGRVVACSTAVASIGILQFVTGVNLATFISIPGLITKVQLSDLLIRDGFNRPSATAAHPLELAAILALSLPLALHRARFAEAGTRGWRWAQVIIIGATLPMTLSRSAVLGLVAVAVALVPTWPRRQRTVTYLVAAAAVGAVWLAVPRLMTVFWGLFGAIGTDPSSQSRLSAYSSAVPFISAHPWLGMGLGTFLPQTYFFVDNQYLTSLIETGVLGLVALAAMFATGWVAARSARRIQADAQTRDLLQCLAAAVLAAAVSFYTFDALDFSIASGLAFLLLGCVGAAWRLAAGSGSSQSQREAAAVAQAGPG